MPSTITTATPVVTPQTLDAIEVTDPRILRDGTEQITLCLGGIATIVRADNLVDLGDAIRRLVDRVEEATLDARDEAREAQLQHSWSCSDGCEACA
jgi:hypothetical protein